MAKALGTLLFRGIVGIVSIAATAVITVLVQRYLYETMGTPAIILPSSVSSPTQSEQSGSEEQSGDALRPDSASPTESEIESEVNTSTGGASDEHGDRRNKIMEQFWDKLNR